MVQLVFLSTYVLMMETSACRFQLLQGKLGHIPLDSSVRLAAVAVETKDMSFKGPLSAEEAVAQPCQNQQSTEKQSEDGKVPKI